LEGEELAAEVAVEAVPPAPTPELMAFFGAVSAAEDGV
jgi:hypothetical protein